MTPIDIENWDRKEIFELFSNFSNPYYMVTFKQDVTKIYEYSKKENVSFYYLMIYLISKSLNSIKNFHYVVRNGIPYYREDDRWPSFTDIKKDSEIFKYITLPCSDDIHTFSEKIKKCNESQNCLLNMEAEGDNLIYISCIPWVDATAITNAIDTSDRSFMDTNIPMFSWGKYTEENGKKTLCISVEVNHRFIDGLHIGKFSEKLNSLINEL